MVALQAFRNEGVAEYGMFRLRFYKMLVNAVNYLFRNHLLPRREQPNRSADGNDCDVEDEHPNLKAEARPMRRPRNDGPFSEIANACEFECDCNDCPEFNYSHCLFLLLVKGIFSSMIFPQKGLYRASYHVCKCIL
jgi:hypothetical protein